MLLGKNACPIVYSDSGCTTAVVAISYPFLDEGNCSSFIFIMSGAEILHTFPDFRRRCDSYKIARNMLLACAGVSGYELEPCAVPEGCCIGDTCDGVIEQFFCSRSPNPFTPNGDGMNDYCQFTFEGIGQKEATIYIHDMYSREIRRINVPTGATAKWVARWDGRDDNGNPLPPGIYLYTIESEGEQVCEGSVTIAR